MADLINLYRQAEDYFFRGIASQCLNLDASTTAYMTGIPVADLNLVYITKPSYSLDKILSQSKQFYDTENLSFVVIVPKECCTPEIESILNTMEYSQTGQSVSMGFKVETTPDGTAPHFDDGTLIRSNDDQLNDWMLPLVGAFESTVELCSMYVATHENALKKHINLYHFSLYMREKPIASMTLSLHNAIARIDDVGTLPEFQGKGYATRLMTYALSEAKKLGAHHCFLEASDSGLGLYQKLGFESLFKNNIYSRKA